jgi:SAM-dependent methyltransferase
MKRLVTRLQDRFYPDPKQRNPVEVFLHQLIQLASRNARFLDVGAGSGRIHSYAFKGAVKEIIGVDVHDGVLGNPLLDTALVYDGSRIPLTEESIDTAFSIYVQEHVQHPSTFVAEIARVLKPGGTYMALTPNRLHYVPAIARLTPFRFHQWQNRLRGRSPMDAFPTFYHLNDRRQIMHHFGNAGLRVESLQFIEVQPNYLLINPALFLLGVAYERLVNSCSVLSFMRVNIIITVRKDADYR